jgi:DUF1680 family protein
MDESRRTFIKLASLLGLPSFAMAEPKADAPVTPFPLEAVRLRPSPYLTAVESNGVYLLRLEPDRLLHNFRISAGLQPKGAVYGGWESQSLAGHSLGHYLSACSLMSAQTGDDRYRQRVHYIVGELAECQAAHGDGYVGGFTRDRDKVTEDGKAIFAEIVKGDIRSRPFNLNGAWSPLYTLHKLLAGLIDANEADALKVALGLGRYLEGVFSKLSDEQMQKMLACEYGGLNESFMQLYERTSDPRWLATAKRIYDHKVLDPLSRREDELDGLHSNTQVPKIIGIARLHAATGDAAYGTAAQFFWQSVTQNHSYVIGGNADRESFESPLSQYITDQTCEACNTYNMLKLTRHLYQSRPDAAYFDYYERAHLNHILAQHDPDTGMFAYMMPLMAGARREFSTPFGDFWCCVGTGMESHSKHGDSIYWQRGNQLFVNLYIPSELTWKERGITLAMRTDYPYAGDVILDVTRGAARNLAISFRVPAWCEDASLQVNGQPANGRRQNGYLTVRRSWKAGDQVHLQLPMKLRAEPIRDDASVVALMRGPMVMAADLAPADEPWQGDTPVLVAATTADAVNSIDTTTGSVSRPPNLVVKPFFSQYDRRSAVYFPRFTEQQWQIEEARLAAVRKHQAEIEAASVDVLQLGENQSERDHELKAASSETVLYRGRSGRWARSDVPFEFRMRVTNDLLTLHATYWGKQRGSRFRILVDDVVVGTESWDGNGPIMFIEREYIIPKQVTKGKQSVVVRFEGEKDAGAGPVFGCRVLKGRTVTV